MASRGSAIDRVLAFYRTASHDTVRVTHQLASEIVAERGIGRKVAGTGAVRKTRKTRSTSQTEVAAGTAATTTSGGQL